MDMPQYFISPANVQNICNLEVKHRENLSVKHVIILQDVHT